MKKTKIGILTQPLRNNYGGVLQNFALQNMLVKLGYNPITFDIRPRAGYIWYLITQVRTLVFYFFKTKRRPFRSFQHGEERVQKMSDFVNKHITTTHRIQKMSSVIPWLYGCRTIIVGSDQVWRPKYNTLDNTFLSFVKSNKIIKIAYAASFGTSDWEFTKTQTVRCATLIKDFRAVSVRENSGIKLCEDYLGMSAEEVLDPTLLLSSNDYNKLCSNICKNDDNFIAAYILDIDDDKTNFMKIITADLKMPVKFFSAEKDVSLGVDEWLAMFRDAKYIITDSFHGTVFSIIYNKEFVSLKNSDRGADRFVSLLSKFNLSSRCINPDELNFSFNNRIDWSSVNDVLDVKREKSRQFLRNNISQL